MMEDKEIVQLYWQRSEEAITQTDRKYGSYCFSVAKNILPSQEDAQECVNDTYMAAWETIPPHRPDILSTFLGKLTRRISIDRWRSLSAAKRGGCTVDLAYEELEECIPEHSDPLAQVEAKELAEAISRFLATLPKQERQIFLARYFAMKPLECIQKEYRFTGGKLRTMLYRTRNKLRSYLAKEGF